MMDRTDLDLLTTAELVARRDALQVAERQTAPGPYGAPERRKIRRVIAAVLAELAARSAR